MATEAPDAMVAHDVPATDIIATSTSSSKPFRFFDLPRELRNIIYGRLARRTLLPLGNVGGAQQCAVLEPTLSTNLLLVNKQFKAEYKEEVSLKPHRLESQHEFAQSLMPYVEKYSTLAAFLNKVEKLHLHTGHFINNPMAVARMPKLQPRTTRPLLDILPRLETIKVSHGEGVFLYEKWLHEGYDMANLSPDSTRQWLWGTAIPSDVKIETEIILVGQLFGVPTAPGGDFYMKNHSGKNMIAYRVIPTSDQGAYLGVVWGVDSEGTGSFEEVEEDVASGEAPILWKTGYKFLRG